MALENSFFLCFEFDPEKLQMPPHFLQSMVAVTRIPLTITTTKEEGCCHLEIQIVAGNGSGSFWALIG